MHPGVGPGRMELQDNQLPEPTTEMQLKTLLNRVEKHKGFVYDRVDLVGGEVPRLVAHVRPRACSKPKCSVCGVCGPHYDTQRVRYFQFVPVWCIRFMFAYAMRRVSCSRCGSRSRSFPGPPARVPSRRVSRGSLRTGRRR